MQPLRKAEGSRDPGVTFLAVQEASKSTHYRDSGTSVCVEPLHTQQPNDGISLDTSRRTGKEEDGHTCNLEKEQANVVLQKSG